MLNSKILRCALLFAIVFSTCAQAQKLKYGVKGGVNVSDFSLRTNSFGQGFKNLWKPAILSHIGGYLEKPLSKKLSVQTELLYSINGSNASLFKAYAHYLSIPLLLNLNIDKRLVLEMGPQLSFVHKARKSMLLMNSRTDFGITAGCRVNLNPSVNVGLRYIQGLAPLSNWLTTDDGNGNAKVLRDFYSRNLQLSVAYQLSRR